MRPYSGCAHALSRMPVLYSGAVNSHGTIRSWTCLVVSSAILMVLSVRGVGQEAAPTGKQLPAKSTISWVALENASAVFTRAGWVLYSSRV